MDSGNSGSIQSSSGGDEEFDSRAERFSSFMNSSSHVGGMSSNPQQQQQQQQPPSQHHIHSSTLFDPLTSYLDVFSRSTPSPSPTPNSLLNLDIVWPRNLRSEPNCPQTSSIIGSSSSSSIQPDPTHFPNPSDHDNSTRVPASSSDPIRNTKKRSRASRRAPTTVLTTDTSNFRAMVQEFTGIPAPPFSPSPFARNRFDLFNSSSTMMRSGHLDHPPPPPPPHLLRPFAHNASNSTSTNNNYQLLPSELGLQKQSQNLLNMENPILTFQSLLQSPPNKYPFGAKSQAPLPIPSMDSRLKVGVLEEFGTSLGGFPSIGINSDGDYGNSQRVSTCKMNFVSASSSDFHHHADKGSENVSSRGEGYYWNTIFTITFLFSGGLQFICVSGRVIK